MRTSLNKWYRQSQSHRDRQTCLVSYSWNFCNRFVSKRGSDQPGWGHPDDDDDDSEAIDEDEANDDEAAAAVDRQQ